MSSFDLINCEAKIGPLLYFIYIGEIIAGFIILLISFLKKKGKENYLLNPIVGIGSFVFLIIFSITNFITIFTSKYRR
jgi:hypothetical protein